MIHHCGPGVDSRQTRASQRLGYRMDENVPYPWAVADTRKCGTFGIGCTADFDLSELQGSRVPEGHRDI